MENIISHHGRKGQKWGIQNGPPYPLRVVSQKSYKLAQKGKKRTEELQNDHIIPQSTKIYRSSSDPDEKLKGSTYVTYVNIDRDLYKGGYIKQRDKKDVYEHSFELNKDLKVAGKDTIEKSVKELIKDKKLLHESVNSYLNLIAPEGSAMRKIIESPINGKYDKNAFDNFVKKSVEKRSNTPVEQQFGSLMASLGKSNRFKDALIRDLQSKGYQAMSDQAGIKGIGNTIEGIDPLIIFDSKDLNPTTSHKVSTVEEARSNKEYQKWQKKAYSRKREW